MTGEMKLVIVDGKQIRTDNKLRVGKRIHGSGTITRTWNHPSDGPILPTKEMCHGCRDDFYNGEGAKECWMFKKACVVNKVGYSTLHVMNGPDTIMEKTLGCWHAVSK